MVSLFSLKVKEKKKLKYCHSEHFLKKNYLKKLHLQNKHIESIMNTAQTRLESGAYHDKDLKGFVKGRPKVKILDNFYKELGNISNYSKIMAVPMLFLNEPMVKF